MRALSDYGQKLAAGWRQSAQVRPGCLILCDEFAGRQAHGKLAAQAAVQQGFAGPLLAVSFEDSQDPDFLERSDKVMQHVQAWGEASDGAVIRRELYESMLGTRVNLLETASDRLLALAHAGVRQAALNLSLGSTPALCATAVLEMCAHPETREQALAQLSRAFALDPERLRAGEARETARMHAELVDLAHRTSADERLETAQGHFASTVVQFEKAHNSVVVAAGNDGTVSRRLLCAIPEGFTRSDFVTPETTVVGALEIDGQRAAYTGDPASVEVWASGVVGPGVQGTSFAAPRVAAALASLHGGDPTLTSQAAEELLTNAPGTPATTP